MKKIILSAGNVVVSRTPAVLEMVLGSCVAVCMWDEVTGAGGMNHFMVPYRCDGLMNRGFYCPDSTVDLINQLLKIGATTGSLRAKIFGGGKPNSSGWSDVGRQNIEVAKMILSEHGISLIAELADLSCGLKIIFFSNSGKVFVKKIDRPYVITPLNKVNPLLHI